MASYTNQRPTRVYRRETDTDATYQRSSIGNTQPIPAKEGLLEGISISQIIAGAAAAATSMVLASYIGLAGSVIGAAVSSVVTVISSQVYRKFLTAGAEKLKDGRDALGDALRTGRDGTPVIDTAARTQQLNGLEGQPVQPTRVVPVRGARVAPATLQARAAAERAGTQRKVLAFSVGIAVVAVVVCATAILIGTAGEGLGEKTQPLFPAPPTEQAITDDASDSDVPRKPGADDAPVTDDQNTDAPDGGHEGPTSEGATTDGDNASAGDSASSGSSSSDGNSSAGTGTTTGNTSTGTGTNTSTGSGTDSSGAGGSSSSSSGSSGGTADGSSAATGSAGAAS